MSTRATELAPVAPVRQKFLLYHTREANVASFPMYKAADYWGREVQHTTGGIITCIAPSCLASCKGEVACSDWLSMRRYMYRSYGPIHSK